MIANGLTPSNPIPRPRGEELRVRYAAYRRRHATRLVHLLPKEAIRPLYRRASGEGDRDPGSDPLQLLVTFCESLLPLPPFEVWEHDLRSHPEAHLHDLDESPAAPTADAPSTLAVRPLDAEGSRWWAQLRSFRDESVWRGYIAYEDVDTGRLVRTALIFTEEHPTDVRERFLDLEIETLRAFLRSTLP